MARRASERGDAGIGGSARKGREVAPDWARGLTPDQIEAEQQARRLPGHTDPDSIDDSDVRERFLARMQHVADTGDDYGEPERPNLVPSPRTPAGGSRTRRRGKSASIPTPTLRPPSRLSVADGSGFALGLILYAIGINYLRYGPAGVRGWLSAKFLNKPMSVGG